jgi:hypothetical protein
MKSIVWTERKQRNNGTLHIETPLGIVNIRVGLSDLEGHKVDSIEVIPNADYPNEGKVIRDGYGNTRLVQLFKDQEYMTGDKDQ